MPKVPPLPTILASLVLNLGDKFMKGLEILFLPARRPNPKPAVISIFPIDLVPTIYSEEYQPVPIKSLRPMDNAGKYFFSLSP